jgi:hypothetical protein
MPLMRWHRAKAIRNRRKQNTLQVLNAGLR